MKFLCFAASNEKFQINTDLETKNEGLMSCPNLGINDSSDKVNEFK
jgi:hypothetical protein